MTVSELLRELESRQISLAAKGNKLCLKGKGAALPADLREELKAHRMELLAAVNEGCGRSEISLSPPAADHLLSRLQAGSRWLTTQHEAWLEGKGNAASDERFSATLVAWDGLERVLRQVYGYDGCIFGPDRRRPGEAAVVCDFCTSK
jgi:hypothetical protein